MNRLGFFIFCVLIAVVGGDDILLDNLFSEISSALNAGEGKALHQYPYMLQNNGIRLEVYEALRSIAKNDELSCVPRLLCEAAAGGQPGYSGKQLKFDKVSLTNLLSYLNLDVGSTSPLLVFGKAALLGVSNRGDPYSCIINYPKCPKDQNRLLHYLNNHRGGFFQYFDKEYEKPGNYYYPQQFRPIYHLYSKKQKFFKKNKIQFVEPGGLYEKFKKKAISDIYATKYSHSALTFPTEGSYSRSKPMVFPKNDVLDPRILSKPVRIPESDFHFSSSSRFPKKLNDFFPQSDNPQTPPAVVATDRLPSRFYFPENETPYTNYPTRYSTKSFFPNS